MRDFVAIFENGEIEILESVLIEEEEILQNDRYLVIKRPVLEVLQLACSENYPPAQAPRSPFTFCPAVRGGRML